MTSLHDLAATETPIRRRKLSALGLDDHRVWQSAGNRRGSWWNAGASHMNRALPREWFEQQGLISVLDTVRGLAVFREPPWYGTVCSVV
jgi:hypothetical protein